MAQVGYKGITKHVVRCAWELVQACLLACCSHLKAMYMIAHTQPGLGKLPAKAHHSRQQVVETQN